MISISKRATLSRRDVLATAGLAGVLGYTGNVGAAAGTTEEEQRNEKVVGEFIAAFNARDTQRVSSFLAPDARFSAGRIGVFAPLRPPAPLFTDFINRTKSISMTVKPNSTSARGPMVTHERVDRMVLVDGTTNGSGTFFAVFGLRNSLIVDFIDFQID